MKVRSSDSKTAADLGRAEKELSDLYVIARKGTEDSLFAYERLGKRLCQLKEEVGHGEFLRAAKRATSLGPSQLNVYMTLHRDAAAIDKAIEWAVVSGLKIKTNTPEARYKLLGKWKTRDSPPKKASAIDEVNGNHVVLIYNLWAHPNTRKGEVENAEFKLHRFAARQKKSLHAFLKAFGLGIPGHRKFGLDDIQEQRAVPPKVIYLGSLPREMRSA